MDIERLARDFGKACGKLFQDKKEKTIDKIDITQIGSVDLFKIVFKRLYHEGNYNKAENIIFDEFQKNNSPELYTIAVDFYDQLLEKSDEELQISNFSRKEIYQGLEDIKRFNA